MKNALRLEEKEAALVIKDAEAEEKLPSLLPSLLADERSQKRLAENIGSFARPDADEKIADQIIALIKR